MSHSNVETLSEPLCEAQKPVYPRPRGEQSITVAPAFILPGLSPQVRGTLHGIKVADRRLRFIPAGAGNTSPGGGPPAGTAVYPRRCVEHASRHLQNERLGGLSPQVRGTPGTTSRVALEKRFIPAGAGNTWGYRRGRDNLPVYPRRCGEHDRTRSRPWRAGGLSPQVRGTRLRSGRCCIRPSVYPRRCGEHRLVQGVRDAPFGLSPQVRGTRSVGSPNDPQNRFIPAGAGNTPTGNHGQLVQAVYPRRCGEHTSRKSSPICQRGLSPQVRGTPMHQNQKRIQKTVYPRRCGEHSTCDTSGWATGGLSPQVRGTREKGQRQRAAVRFIPAGAGNTQIHTRCRVMLTVYPRRCGEHRFDKPIPIPGAGLSPQVRGTLRHDTYQGEDHRFIPAGAGNTHRGPVYFECTSVYPRRCGEHQQISDSQGPEAGLSPQVRGTRLRAWDGYAHCAVYPRRCGEHSAMLTPCSVATGLSPQVRGTQILRIFGQGAHRFIPAGAGNTRSPFIPEDHATVYPRRCGEHNNECGGGLCECGLSPQVRGTRLLGPGLR